MEDKENVNFCFKNLKLPFNATNDTKVNFFDIRVGFYSFI